MPRTGKTLLALRQRKTVRPQLWIPSRITLFLRLSQLKHPQQPLERVLPIETGIREPALFIVPLGQSAVVKSLLAVLDEEGNNIEPQALLQSDQPPDSAVAVLEGMDLLERRVEGDDVL